MRIGTLENYYGEISVEKDILTGKYYWTLEDHTGIQKEEIPKYLYEALVKFEKERTK